MQEWKLAMEVAELKQLALKTHFNKTILENELETLTRFNGDEVVNRQLVAADRVSAILCNVLFYESSFIEVSGLARDYRSLRRFS